MQAFLNLRFLTPYQVLATLGVHLGEGREREFERLATDYLNLFPELEEQLANRKSFQI